MNREKSNLIGRLGNKENDIKYFYEYLPKKNNVYELKNKNISKNIKHIVEPFGGSFAVSRCIYNDDYFKKHVNDLDINLYSVYTNLDEYAKFTNDIMENEEIINKKTFFTFLENYKISKPLKDFFVQNYIIRGTILKKKKIRDYSQQIKLFKTIDFTNNDYIDILEKYKYCDDAFIFLDPPYLFSDNSGYTPQNVNKDMTNIIIEIKKIMEDPKTKCLLMLIINKLNILEYLFNDFIKCEYTRVYQMSKKKMQHLVITNY